MRLVPLVDSTAPIGHKGETLRHLASSGYPVPQAFVIEDIPLADPLTSLESVRADLDLLFAGPLRGRRVVARSSAADEDVPMANASGVYESYLNLGDTDAVITAVTKGVSAASQPDAVAYRRAKGTPDPTSMCVLVQEQVECEVAGALITLDPVPPHESQLIEWVRGLGTAVVSGDGGVMSARLDRSAAPLGDPEASDWAFGSEDELFTVLQRLGCRLEHAYGAPQEIEWGARDGRVFLFQSRNASLSLSPDHDFHLDDGDDGTEVLSPGIAIGRLVRDPVLADANSIVMVDRLPGAAGMVQLAVGRAVVARTGNVASHASAMAREFALPVVRSDVVPQGDGLICVDANRGSIVALANLTVEERKRAIFFDLRARARRESEDWVADNGFESVVVDPLFRRRIDEWALAQGSQVVSRTEDIYPFDDPARTYTGISARIKSDPSRIRVQFKRATMLRDRPGRWDEEIHHDGMTRSEADAFLAERGYVPFEPQQRQVDTLVCGPITLSSYTWPGGRGWTGVEAVSFDDIDSMRHQIGLPEIALTALDGKRLFDRLAIPLAGLRF